jgi:hypothetical protein
MTFSAPADSRPENTQRPAPTDVTRHRQELIREIFSVVDAKNIEGFLKYLTPDATFRFGNAPALIGHETIRNGLVPFYASINALQHKILGVWVADNIAFSRMEVQYTRLDGRLVTLPVGNFFSFRDELIADYHVYMDIGPVYAELA